MWTSGLRIERGEDMYFSTWEFIRWGGIIALVGTFAWVVWYTTDIVGLLERKKSGKRPLRAERLSRERVQAALNDPSTPPKDKCLFLNNELELVMDSIFVSREWKDALHEQATAIMKENGLTLADF